MPVLSIILIFASFALSHSLLAADRTKGLAARVAGAAAVKAFYRLSYVIVSSVTALIAFYFIAELPDKAVWRPPVGVSAIMSLIQLAGMALGLSAFAGMDFREFIGVKQAINRFKGIDNPSDDPEGINQRLVTGGLYRVIRHPLYMAGILIFSFFPVITRNRLAVSALADLYFVYGALVEERRLIKRFGRDYRDYMEKTPRFIPKMRF